MFGDEPIKLTKNELKSQRDSLKRFQRYLPTLLLKKQQLQMEIRKLENDIKLAILKRAAFLEKNKSAKNADEFKKSGKKVITGPTGN